MLMPLKLRQLTAIGIWTYLREKKHSSDNGVSPDLSGYPRGSNGGGHLPLPNNNQAFYNDVQANPQRYIPFSEAYSPYYRRENLVKLSSNTGSNDYASQYLEPPSLLPPKQ